MKGLSFEDGYVLAMMSENEVPIFEFTYKGEKFEIFEEGYVRVSPTLALPGIVVINRIPQRIHKAELQAIADD